MGKISLERVVALKRAGLVTTFRTVGLYVARLLKTSRVYCSKRRDQTGSSQSHHSVKRDFTHFCTRKFTIHIYIYSYSYSPHHAKLQTPFKILPIFQSQFLDSLEVDCIRWVSQFFPCSLESFCITQSFIYKAWRSYSNPTNSIRPEGNVRYKKNFCTVCHTVMYRTLSCWLHLGYIPRIE